MNIIDISASVHVTYLTCYLNRVNKKTKIVFILLSQIVNYLAFYKLSKKVLFSDNSAVVPPDSIPNSEVKRSSADGSVGVPM